MLKKELDLNGKIRNLQVSISIYKKEAREILDNWETYDDVLKIKKRYRLEVIQASITKKEHELIPLKEERIHRIQGHYIDMSSITMPQNDLNAATLEVLLAEESQNVKPIPYNNQLSNALKGFVMPEYDPEQLGEYKK